MTGKSEDEVSSVICSLSLSVFSVESFFPGMVDMFSSKRVWLDLRVFRRARRAEFDLGAILFVMRPSRN
jgi:hypothetical protein